MPKMKHLTISFPHYNHNAGLSLEDRLKPHNCLYRIEKAVDTTEYPPTTLLNKREVDELCAASGWNITIVRRKDEEKKD